VCSRIATLASKCTLLSLGATVMNPLDPNSPLVCAIGQPQYTKFLLRNFFFRPPTHTLPDMPSGGPVRTERSVHSLEQMWSIIGQSPRSSILFKGMLNESTLTVLHNKFTSAKGRKKFPAKSFGSGDRSYFSTGETRKRKTASVKEIADGTVRSHYLGFLPLGFGQKVLDLRSRRAINDISFASNGETGTITTPNHGHWPTDSVSFQVAGKKIWLLQDPDDLHFVGSQLVATKEGAVQYSAKRVKSLSRMKYAVVERGDALYFPNYALHMVYTLEGMNLMITMNYLNIQKAFHIQPLVTLQMVLSFAVSKGMGMVAAYFQGTMRIDYGQHSAQSPHTMAINKWGSNVKTTRDERLYAYLHCLGSAISPQARAGCGNA